MSFTPLPKIFTDTCLDPDSPRPQILELGCGDGRFGAILAARGIFSWGLDLVGPELGTAADFVGNALSPPVTSGSLDVLLAPNILRHLVPADPAFGFLPGWMGLLKPRGSLFILEDEPSSVRPGFVNYRDLQVFLGRLMPESRGPLLALDDFKVRLGDYRSRVHWEFGLVRNRQTIDAGAVVDFLSGGGSPSGEPGRLMREIDRHGIDPGFFWWARAQAPVEGTVF